ncbi:phosphatase PAP2 family protein [Hahella aquimaris]|uniref:phosphatase PAP2 family protein n=1 Tax=Hahella sp. HNIBRBA332 TaxID=3015983 RepID=UPI00273B2E0B|nr:phosphatase PAP2 family protein [Hahella sp. HNIBRBA332]WLQ11561.1 phosphatase PAP2 family protein [Hahella sp. HNIBRBA332]
MNQPRASELFRRADELEQSICRTAIAWARRRRLAPFFRLVSRLGDGVFWYALIGVVCVIEGWETGRFMIITALTCTLIYKLLKLWLVRERPFITHNDITCDAKVLDKYSFPSGHTLHAVCFTLLTAEISPVLALCVLPFTLCVALSRVVLGLHYPSDVLVGAAIGFSVGATALAV